MANTTKLYCPIRGQLNISDKAKDQLTPTEEKLRIDCIKFLLSKKYQKGHFKIETTLLKFGNKGRNSFRTDLVVFDCPVAEIQDASFDEQIEHAVLFAEIKRDNKDSKEAKAMQVKPAMAFLPDSSSLGVYWDDVEQRLFYFVQAGKKRTVHEAAINKLPNWGGELGSIVLKYKDLQPAKNLLRTFEQIEDELHTHTVDKSKRFQVLLQLLLCKMYDEKTHEANDADLVFQDFSAMKLNESSIKAELDTLLGKAIKFYGKYLPEVVPISIHASGAALRQATKYLAPLNVLGSGREVIQNFYMYFAKGLYKWELAQYFTPTEVVDCVIEVLNPRIGEHVKDPACGSADFLISAFRWAADHGWKAADTIWGSDNSSQAVQVSILNMVLNGDGKTNIRLEDSLENVKKYKDHFDIMVCNPPFGVRIKESRPTVLSNFALGHEWQCDGGTWKRTDEVVDSQETGILFAELCIREALPGGRIGIVVPNGYLGNRSGRYTAFRNWILRNARVVSVISLPRFTFKKSGADVSASLLILEKRDHPLSEASESKPYAFHVGLVTSVGWSVGDKRAERIFKRESETGVFVVDGNNDPVPDADFREVLDDLLRSEATNHFGWLLENRQAPDGEAGWSVQISTVLSDSALVLDPKRLNRKFVSIRKEIQKVEHFKIRDVVEILPEAKPKTNANSLLRYVEIGDIWEGGYSATQLRGWQLPSRARHKAMTGDIFAGKIWGSVGKWFMAGGKCDDLVVTNGCYRLRIKKDKAALLPDLIVGMCSEAYRVQMRGFATGSDGLAEISETDMYEVLLPRLKVKESRDVAERYLELYAEDHASLKNVVGELEVSGKENLPNIPARKTVFVQV